MSIIPDSFTTSKISCRCNICKPFANFTIDRNTKDGYDYRCRQCLSIINKEKYLQHIKQGNCPQCGQPNDSIFKWCKTCRNKDKPYREEAGHCVLCGFPYADVHHKDRNHKNNDPANLINLCPNHHKMVHWGLLTLL